MEKIGEEKREMKNNRIVMLCIGAMVAGMLFGFGCVSADEVHIGVNESIQDAVDAASPGDTVIVKDGYYNESVVINKRLTVKSENGPESTFIFIGDGHLFKVEASGVNLFGFTIKGARSCGVYLDEVSNCNISGNIVNDCYQGIFLDGSSNSVVFGNIASDNEHNGIILVRDSNNNQIIGNTATDSNSSSGIYVNDSINCNICDNVIEGNNNYGLTLRYSTENTVTNNTANGNIRDGIKLYNAHMNEIRSNIINANKLSGMYVKLSDENRIFDNEISDSLKYHGISLNEACKNVIANNIVQYSGTRGILLYGQSNNNTIVNNQVAYNKYGMFSKNSIGNQIYLNDFVENSKENAESENSVNEWNTSIKQEYTYKEGTYEYYMGNYWSDYDGVDMNVDGIGDDYYLIWLEKDYYPLMEPFMEYTGKVEPTPTPTLTPIPTPILTPTPTPQGTFDTGEDGYPSIAGTHTGTIRITKDIILSAVYTYPCEGTNGHITSIEIYEDETGRIISSISKGELQARSQRDQWIHPIARTVLEANKTYGYIITTKSYPQMIHGKTLEAKGGTITCEKFVDVNGNVYNDWIPAFKLE